MANERAANNGKGNAIAMSITFEDGSIAVVEDAAKLGELDLAPMAPHLKPIARKAVGDPPPSRAVLRERAQWYRAGCPGLEDRDGYRLAADGLGHDAGEDLAAALSFSDPRRARGRILDALEALPDEAFGWFVAWAMGGSRQFPPGLGGFLPESERAILALREAAEEYVNAQTLG